MDAIKTLVNHLPYQLKSEIMCHQKLEGTLKHSLNLGNDDYLVKECSVFILSYETVLDSEKYICKSKLKLSFVLITLPA